MVLNGQSAGEQPHGSFATTREVNAQNVCTVVFACTGAGSIAVCRRVEDRIRKSCRLLVMSLNSSFFPLHDVLKSATQVSGDTFESAKLPRNRSDRSASSFGELLTC